MNVAKLKDQARRHEQNQEWQKALDLYLKVLEHSGEDEEDLALYNRVGDLYARVGDTQKAVEYYESAVDRYVDADLHNSAIALCKKILRNVPGRTSLYLRLGQICAEQGFVTDARQNFLEYAERMQQAGSLDEAFRALLEFADLVPSDLDIREVLAAQLEAHGRGAEAAQQLLVVYRTRRLGGEEAGAEEVAERIRVLDPELDLAAAAAAAAAVVEEEEEVVGLPGLAPLAPAGEEPGGEVEVELGEIQIGGLEAEAEEEGAAEPEAGFAVGADLGVSDFSLAVEGVEEEEAEVAAAPEGEPPEFVIESEEEEEAAAEPLPMLEVGEEAAEAGAEIPLLDLGEEEEEAAQPLPMLEVGEAGPSEEAAEVPAVAAGDLVAVLQARLEQEPDDYDAWVKLGEELLERGQREGGVEALERGHRGFADQGDIDSALRVTRELLRMEPDSVRLHQKLVEYAFRKNDAADLIPAYLGLGGCLERAGQDTKAKAVYQRVLDLDAVHADAAAGIGRIEGVPTKAEAKGEEYVDLGALVLDEEVERTTRFVVAEEEPSGDEDADFARMLAQFKSKVSHHVEAEDYSSHYDLGVAFKEMGLLDEAIAEFQQALRGRTQALRAYEMLGQCFLEKGQPTVAVKTLTRALSLPYTVEDELLGVYYYLGRSHEEAGEHEAARDYYEKVFGLDISFQDISERLRALQ